jgi:ABC-type multidrug transport system fused ATPase/permease subunit
VVVMERGRIVEHGERAALAADSRSHFARLASGAAGVDGGEPTTPTVEVHQ